MTFSREARQIRAHRLSESDSEFAYRMGRAAGQAEALKRAITLLTYLEKTSGSKRPGVTEALELVKTITVFESDLLKD